MSEVDPRYISRVLYGHIEVQPSRHMATWEVHSHKGWRGFLIYRLHFPKWLFKAERRNRLFYLLSGKHLICSYENAALLERLIEERK